MKLGLIIPFRDRSDHLMASSPILKQFGHLYVVEQMDKQPFNRGKLINCAFIEFKKEFDYFAAHDCDLIPQAMGYYTYSDIPCHLATEAEQFGYRLPYDSYFGGVTLFPNEVFEKVNGFSNEIFGYGTEDDLIRRKIDAMSIPIKSRQCRFTSLPHSRNIDNALRLENAKKLKEPIQWGDGLTSCKYEVIHCEDLEHYTLLQVKL